MAPSQGDGGHLPQMPHPGSAIELSPAIFSGLDCMLLIFAHSMFGCIEGSLYIALLNIEYKQKL